MAGHLRKVGENRYRLEYMLDGQKYSKNVKANSTRQADKLNLYQKLIMEYIKEV